MTSIILLFCAEVSAAVFENESVFSFSPFPFFSLCSPVRRCLPPSREQPQGAALERSSGRRHQPSPAQPSAGAPGTALPAPSALRAGRKGRAELPFLLLLRRGGEVSGTFWRCRRKRPGGAGGAAGPGQRHGQVGPGGPALDRGGAGGRHQREQLALVSSGNRMGMRGRAAGGNGRPALTPPLPGQDGAGRDQLVQEEAEGGAGGAGGGGRGRALRDRRPQTRGGRSVLQQPQRETHLLLRVEPAPQLERYGGKGGCEGLGGDRRALAAWPGPGRCHWHGLRAGPCCRREPVPSGLGKRECLGELQ